jgi:1-acyl-sn-glycerol-3-phosphate acyltransferase
MQAIVVAKPYKFVPPHRGTLWPALLQLFRGRLLRGEGVTALEFRGVEKIAASVAAGHGIMLTPNHCRPGDPFVIGALGHAVGRHVHIMASWHLFMQGRVQRFLLPRAGVFSIYREGLDREALKCAGQILAEARRPLVIFPEGVISRHNDHLNSLMEGTALIARTAAKQRAAASPAGRVVIHPVAIRYLFEGDLRATVEPMLADIEQRLSWRVRRDLPLAERIARIGVALLGLKETEYLGAPQSGGIGARTGRLIDHLLRPLEDEWLKGRHDGDVVARVKLLRTALLPDLVTGQLSEGENARRWNLLAQLYLTQQLAFYPEHYLNGNPPPERILETVERFEEDLTDRVRQVTPLRALLDVGDAIEVSPERVRGGEDPLMKAIRTQLESMLQASLAERRPGSTWP